MAKIRISFANIWSLIAKLVLLKMLAKLEIIKADFICFKLIQKFDPLTLEI